MKKLLFRLLCLVLVFSSCKKEEGETPYIIENSSTKTELELNVSGFDNLNGNLAIAIHNNSQQFESNSICYKDTIIDIIANETSIIITVHPGTYSVSVFHDENKNNQLDVNGLGIPEEGFGFSNNPSIGFSSPDFNDCKFVITEGQSMFVPISLNYLL